LLTDLFRGKTLFFTGFQISKTTFALTAAKKRFGFPHKAGTESIVSTSTKYFSSAIEDLKLTNKPSFTYGRVAHSKIPIRTFGKHIT